MSNDKIDPNKNPADVRPTEVPTEDSKTELTEEELKKVSGGSSKSWGIIVGSL